MPPKKDSFSELDLRRIAYDHGIRLKGPVPPAEWPDNLKHHFQTVRALQFLQYEKYKGDQGIPLRRRSEFQQRVRDIREKIQDLLDDVNPNERSWRKLEPTVFARFEGLVICAKCNRDLVELDYEANCANQGTQAKLDAKRRSRKLCVCRSKRSSDISENDDDEHGKIFEAVEQTTMSHAFGDNLESRRISMEPDIVFGLRAPSSIAPSYTHFPAQGFPAQGRGKLLLPFLVVEAKKERAAPGFRSVLYQTAFPIRRFLKAQADIDGRDSSCEPCLVWFFAYQGETWRLHAGTLDQDKTKVYDLWQGNIHTQDGALQLLLLVDYIWSWARDVYRPGIRQLIAASTTSLRQVSPISVDRFRTSVSLDPTASTAPNSQPTDQMELDDAVADPEQSQQHLDRAAVSILDTTTHQFPFLRWAVGHESSPSWTALGSIRHANLVRFEFRCYFSVEGYDSWADYPRLDGEVSLLARLYSSCFLITAAQLNGLAAVWTTDNLPIAGLSPTCAFYATFFFLTYCEESSWQITRNLSCIIWHSFDECPVEHLYMDPKPSIVQIRNVIGRNSVWPALRKTSLILQHHGLDRGFEWKSFAQANYPDDAFNTLKGLAAEAQLSGASLYRISYSSCLLWIEPGSGSQVQDESLPWELDARTGNSMLAIRPLAWHKTSPLFCLFVIPEIGDGSASELHDLLAEALSMRHFYGDSEHRWGTEDAQTLRQWRKALINEARIVREGSHVE